MKDLFGNEEEVERPKLAPKAPPPQSKAQTTYQEAVRIRPFVAIKESKTLTWILHDNE